METEIVTQIIDFLPGWAIVVLIFIGSLHLILPPIQLAVSAIVLATPSKKDDEIYREVIESKYFEYFRKFVKYISGLDLKKKQKK